MFGIVRESGVQMNEASTAQGIVAAPAARAALAPFWVALALLGVAVAFYFGDLRALAARWSSSEELSHGFLVAAVVPALFWLQRSRLSFGHRASPIALVGLAVASAAWVVARGANVDLVQWLLLPGIVWFALWIALGARSARALLFPMAYFLLAIPVWNLFLTPLFQWVTVKASTLLLGMAGVQAYIEGSFVQVPAGNFEIAGGCSGMNYLIVGVATAALFSFIERLPWRRTALVVALAVVIAMLANWIRVSYVIYDGNATAMQSPLVQEHATFGWYVFAVAMVPFFLLARRIAHGAPLPESPARMSTDRDAAPGSAWPALLVGVAALGVGAAWGAVLDLRAAREPVPELAMPPVAGWEGPGSPEPDWQPSFPGAAAERLVGYRQGGTVVDVYAAFFSRQSASNKLIGYYADVVGQGGWSEQRREVVTIGGDRDPSTVREHVLGNPSGGQRLIWSWYEVRGRREVGVIAVKMHESLAAFGLAPRSGIVALSARCVPDCEAARAALTAAHARGLGDATAGTETAQ